MPRVRPDTCICLAPVPSGSACADGVLDKWGTYVAEEGQQAFIEWRDGQERLFVLDSLGVLAGRYK